jgi:hypothetical protein
MMGQFGALGGGNAEMTGRGKAWIDPAGNLVRYEMTTRVSAEFNGNAFEITMKRTCDLSDVGKTKVEVPEAVRKLLEAKPAEPPAEKSEDRKKDF